MPATSDEPKILLMKDFVRLTGIGMLMLLVAATAHAQDARTERLALQTAGELTIVEGSVTGRQIVDYVISADHAQTQPISL